jgi:hypothetical protein
VIFNETGPEENPRWNNYQVVDLHIGNEGSILKNRFSEGQMAFDLATSETLDDEDVHKVGVRVRPH